MKSLFLIWVVLFAGHFTPTREFPLNEYPILISYKADIKPRKTRIIEEQNMLNCLSTLPNLSL